MITEFCTITGDSKNDEEVVLKASEIIKNGGLVAIPTETVYGLAGSALYDESAKKIFEAKGRPSDNPLIVHIAKPSDAELFAYTNPVYYALSEKFMPGPLTIILPKRDNIPYSVTGGLDTVAIRCPSNPIAHKLIEVSGHPIAAPSANRSGIPSPTSAYHVKADMDGLIDMIIDGGECEIGLESTVISLDGSDCTILRPGAVTAEMLSEVCDNVSVANAVLNPILADGTKVQSPGMKYKHYSPKAEVILYDCTEDEFVAYINTGIAPNEAVLCEDRIISKLKDCNTLSLGKDSKEAMHLLFSRLREADEREYTKLYAMLPPKTDEYLAFYNRIIRSAAGKTVKLK